MKSIVVLVCLMFPLLPLHAQSRKEIKKYKVKTQQVTKTEDGKTVPDEKTLFDKEGRESVRTEYNKDGNIKTIHQYKYNSSNDVTEELELDAKGAVKEKRLVKYDNLGQKTEELYYDADNKLQKRIVYAYDSKGLKTDKTTYDGAGKVISVKKYTYSF